MHVGAAQITLTLGRGRAGMGTNIGPRGPGTLNVVFDDTVPSDNYYTLNQPNPQNLLLATLGRIDPGLTMPLMGHLDQLQTTITLYGHDSRQLVVYGNANFPPVGVFDLPPGVLGARITVMRVDTTLPVNPFVFEAAVAQAINEETAYGFGSVFHGSILGGSGPGPNGIWQRNAMTYSTGDSVSCS